MKENNYLVLARKYRPQKLSDFIGQEEVCDILRGALKNNRLAHAYLLSGTRGVGKTTLARLIAKIVNCTNKLNDENFDPCGKCSNCVSILEDKNLDVVEIDAASKTGVSDVREIIENINYKPVTALKKIYIIDEVHMLSKAAFNALLKTLEEPPLDVLFLLATTETEKIPVTILSRCQHFPLKRLKINVLTEHIINIAKIEGCVLDKESAYLISRSAEGSVRDALSILDTFLAQGKTISKKTVYNQLCLEDFGNVINLFKKICDSDVKSALNIVNEFYINGSSFENIARDLSTIIYHIARFKSLNTLEFEDLNDYEKQEYQVISKELTMDVIIRLWELIQKYIQEMSQAYDQKQYFEMSVIRLCFVILLPSPFENENKKENNMHTKNLENLENEELNKNIKDVDLDNNSLDKKKNFKNTKKTFYDEELEQFKNIISKIETHGDMVLSHKIKNSFRLVSLKKITSESDKNEIELDNYKNIALEDNLLWKATKVLEKVTKSRWIISISNRKGNMSLQEYEFEKEKEIKSKIATKNSIKKLLEIIPHSKVTSINKLD